MSPTAFAQVARRRVQGLAGLVHRLREVQGVIETSTISSLRAVAVLPSTMSSSAAPRRCDRSYMSGSFASGSRCSVFATNSHGAFEIPSTPVLGATLTRRARFVLLTTCRRS